MRDDHTQEARLTLPTPGAVSTPESLSFSCVKLWY